MADVRARVAEKRARRAYGGTRRVEFTLALDESPLARLSRLAVIAGRRETMEATGRSARPSRSRARATVKAISPFLPTSSRATASTRPSSRRLRELQERHERELERERERRVALELASPRLGDAPSRRADAACSRSCRATARWSAVRRALRLLLRTARGTTRSRSRPRARSTTIAFANNLPGRPAARSTAAPSTASASRRPCAPARRPGFLRRRLPRRRAPARELGLVGRPAPVPRARGRALRPRSCWRRTCSASTFWARAGAPRRGRCSCRACTTSRRRRSAPMRALLAQRPRGCIFLLAREERSPRRSPTCARATSSACRSDVEPLSAADVAEFRARHGLDRPYLVYCGPRSRRASASTGSCDARRRGAPRRHGDVDLVLVGDGPYRPPALRAQPRLPRATSERGWRWPAPPRSRPASRARELLARRARGLAGGHAGDLRRRAAARSPSTSTAPAAAVRSSATRRSFVAAVRRFLDPRERERAGALGAAYVRERFAPGRVRGRFRAALDEFAVRIVVDVSPLSVPPTGIGYYIRETTAALAAGRRRSTRSVAVALVHPREAARLRERLAPLPPAVARRIRTLPFAPTWRRLANHLPLPTLELLAGRCGAFVGSEWLYPRQRSRRARRRRPRPRSAAASRSGRRRRRGACTCASSPTRAAPTSWSATRRRPRRDVVELAGVAAARVRVAATRRRRALPRRAAGVAAALRRPALRRLASAPGSRARTSARCSRPSRSCAARHPDLALLLVGGRGLGPRRRGRARRARSASARRA